MTFRFDEEPNSREATGSPPTVVLRYTARGTQDESFVHAVAFASTPATYWTIYGVLYRQDIRTEPAGFNVWRVSIPYGPKNSTPPPTGQWTFGFNTTGGSFHIKASKSTVNKYPAATAPDYKQLIGVNDGEVQGSDIVIPALKLNVTYKHPAGVVNIAYAKALARLTGKVNETEFLTFDAGEVLFLGASGSDGSEAEAEVGYEFACEENLQDQVVGAVTGIEKDGWDVAWIKWKDDTEVVGADTVPKKVPQFVYVERVYTRVNLAVALGFGG
jgi:hypothetical protein